MSKVIPRAGQKRAKLNVENNIWKQLYDARKVVS